VCPERELLRADYQPGWNAVSAEHAGCGGRPLQAEHLLPIANTREIDGVTDGNRGFLACVLWRECRTSADSSFEEAKISS